jgi:hypothetical protein
MAYLKNNECIFLLLLTFFGLSNNRPFGKRNRPGFPTDMEFVGNFSARATATAAISSMNIKVEHRNRVKQSPVYQTSLLCATSLGTQI